MIVSIHQPNFLPWFGYFKKIELSDVFVILDTAQYTKNSFINRNRIKTSQGVSWLTVPVLVKSKFGQSINEVEIVQNVDWRKKHIGTLEATYRRANKFSQCFNDIISIYNEKNWTNLCEFNSALIKWVLSMLDIKTRIVTASDLGLYGSSTELLIAIVKELGGQIYLSGFGGAKYQDEELFEAAGIKLTYNSFEHPVYQQLWGDFVPNLSILDMIFNCDIPYIKETLAQIPVQNGSGNDFSLSSLNKED